MTTSDALSEDVDEDTTEDEVKTLGALDAMSVRSNSEEEKLVHARRSGKRVGFNLPPPGRYNAAMKVYGSQGVTVRVERVYPRVEYCNTLPGHIVPTHEDLCKHIRDSYWTGAQEQYKWTVRSQPGSTIRAAHTEPIAENPEQKAAWAQRMRDGGLTVVAPAAFAPSPPPKNPFQTAPAQPQVESEDEEQNMAKGYWMQAGNNVVWVAGEPPSPPPTGTSLQQQPQPQSAQQQLQMSPPPGAIWDGTKFMIPPPVQVSDPRIEQYMQSMQDMSKRMDEMQREREREQAKEEADRQARAERERIEQEVRMRIEREYADKAERDRLERERVTIADKQAREARESLERERAEQERRAVELRDRWERDTREQLERSQAALGAGAASGQSAPPGWVIDHNGNWAQLASPSASSGLPFSMPQSNPVQQVNTAGEAFDATASALSQAMRLVNMAQQGGLLPGKGRAAVEAADEDEPRENPLPLAIQSMRYGGIEFPVDPETKKVHWPMLVGQFVPQVVGLAEHYFKTQTAQAQAMAADNHRQAVMLERAMAEVSRQDRIIAQAGLPSGRGSLPSARPNAPSPAPMAHRAEQPTIRRESEQPRAIAKQPTRAATRSAIGDGLGPGVPSTSEPEQPDDSGFQGALGYAATNLRRAQ